MPRIRTLLLTLASAVLTATCSGDGPVGPDSAGGGNRRPAALVKVSGDAQSGTVGTALGTELVVRVNDASGSPLSGVPVSWSVTAGGGSVEPTSTVSDASGQAKTRWTLGTTAGANGAAAAVGSLSAAFSAAGTPDRAATVRLTPDSLSFTALRDTARFTARVLDRHGNALTGASVQWSSGDSAVASVGTDGLVTSRALGRTTLTVRSDTARGSGTVVVRQLVASVKIAPTAATLNAIGDTTLLVATVRDRNAQPVASAGVTWSSLDTTVVTVTSEGRVVSRAVGTARVRAAVDGAADTITVTSRQVAATLSVTPRTPSLSAGDTTRLRAVVADSNGVAKSGAAVSWSSSATGVATVGASTGLVTGVAAGTATVTASSEGVSGTATVTVLSRAPTIGGFFASYVYVDVGQATTFGWRVSDASGGALTCTLDTNGDGTTDHTVGSCGTTLTQRHTYSAAGSYTARLTVSNAAGASTSTTLSVTVGPRTSFSTGQNADLMLSGVDFNNTGGPLLFNHPNGIASDGTRLFLADRNNNRVLVWNTLPTGNTAPDFVLGQPDFTSNNPGRGRNQMNWPVAVHSDGTRLVVADSYNDRLLIWNTIPRSSGQAADLVISGLAWPWGVWTNGSKLVATSTSDAKTWVWNTFPVSDNAPASFSLRSGFGTPRTITSNGTLLSVGDHNPASSISTQQGNFFWNTFPTSDNQPYSYFRNSPFDASAAWLQGDITPEGKLVMLGRYLHVWNTLPSSASTRPDLTVNYEFGGGDGQDAAYVNGKLFLSLGNSNRVVVYNSLPTSASQAPDFAIGAPNLGTNTLLTNYFITNPVPATNGRSLLVSSDFDRKLYVWRTIPTRSGTHPDATISVANQPWANSLWGETFVMAGERTLHIWNSLPLNGEQPDATLSGAGSASFRNLKGVCYNGRYLFLSDPDAGKLWVWDGLPSARTEPAFTLNVAAADRISCDESYLTIVSPIDQTVKVYRISQISSSWRPAGSVGGVGIFNLPAHGLVAQGRLYVSDNFQRLQVWNDVEAAIAGAASDVILGEENRTDTTPEIGRNKLFWPSSLAFDGRYLWVGEFKFSGRLVRYSRP